MKSFRISPYITPLLFLLSIVIALLVGQKVTHQGFVLGIISIVTGLLLIHRMLSAKRNAQIVMAALFVLLELVAIIIVAVGSDPVELWCASVYGIFSGCLIVELIWHAVVIRLKH